VLAFVRKTIEKMANQNGLHQKDTTYTKIFVGGLPYTTTDKSLKEFFEAFGDIEEAVVITDRIMGKSRGYGFVTMTTKEAAALATKDPNPIIDGRKANVNLAFLGAKPRGNAAAAIPFPLRAGWPGCGYFQGHPSVAGYPVFNPYAYYTPYVTVPQQTALSPSTTAAQYLDYSPTYAAAVPESGFQYPFTTAASGIAAATHQAAAAQLPMYTYAAVQAPMTAAANAATPMSHLVQQQQIAPEQM